MSQSNDPIVEKILDSFGLNTNRIPKGTPRGQLIDLLNDSDWRIRSTAAKRLGILGKPQDSALLIQALRDHEAQVRACAAYALGELEEYSTSPVDPLVNATKDQNEHVRNAAAWALGKLAEIGLLMDIQPLVALMDDQDDIVRATAVRGLGLFGEPPVNIIIAALNDASWQVRESAVLALGSLEGHTPLDLLVKTMQIDESEHVRLAAKTTLEHLH